MNNSRILACHESVQSKDNGFVDSFFSVCKNGLVSCMTDAAKIYCNANGKDQTNVP